MLSNDHRYERYAAWCKMLGVKPAPKDAWAREVAKISELNSLNLSS